MNIVFIGPPGAGKGTQASRLARTLNVPHISSGDLLRLAGAQDTPLGRESKRYMAAGQLVPDDLALRIVEQRLAEPDAQGGAVLDGFPRTVHQAERLDGLFAARGDRRVDVAVYIDAPREVVLERMRARRRSDETPEVQERRYDVYERDTLPLLAYYRERGILATVDGEQPVESVTRDIQTAIEARGGLQAASPAAHE